MLFLSEGMSQLREGATDGKSAWKPQWVWCLWREGGGMSPDLPSTEEGGSAAVGRGGERRAFINRQEDLINTGCCGQ